MFEATSRASCAVQHDSTSCVLAGEPLLSSCGPARLPEAQRKDDPQLSRSPPICSSGPPCNALPAPLDSDSPAHRLATLVPATVRWLAEAAPDVGSAGHSSCMTPFAYAEVGLPPRVRAAPHAAGCNCQRLHHRYRLQAWSLQQASISHPSLAPSP